MIRPPPISTLFPYPPLSGSIHHVEVEVPAAVGAERDAGAVRRERWRLIGRGAAQEGLDVAPVRIHHEQLGSTAEPGDRKSTRLNSSHSQISYAVFCLEI